MAIFSRVRAYGKHSGNSSVSGSIHSSPELPSSPAPDTKSSVFSPQSFSAYGKAEGGVKKEKQGKKDKGQGKQQKGKKGKRKADCFSNLFSSQDSEASADDDDGFDFDFDYINHSNDVVSQGSDSARSTTSYRKLHTAKPSSKQGDKGSGTKKAKRALKDSTNLPHVKTESGAPMKSVWEIESSPSSRKKRRAAAKSRKVAKCSLQGLNREVCRDVDDEDDDF